MPLYEYHCSKCDKTFEVIRKFSDSPLTQHEDCGGPLERLLSAPAFQLKGTGWYVTDYGKGGAKSAESSAESKSPEAKAGSSEGKGEAKTSEAKSGEAKSSESKSSESKSRETSPEAKAPAAKSSD